RKDNPRAAAQLRMNANDSNHDVALRAGVKEIGSRETHHHQHTRHTNFGGGPCGGCETAESSLDWDGVALLYATGGILVELAGLVKLLP
ncbi:MAG: hypothetical protein KDA37_17465, partial [Planctomycetales bacterium]|nr:hypothetical protein [Planctomycetales bacterium]